MFCVSVNEDAVPCHAEWFHNENPVTSTPKRLMKDDSNVFTLTVKGLQITDDGHWACQVQNDLGRVRDECTLTLKGALTLTEARLVDWLKKITITFSCLGSTEELQEACVCGEAARQPDRRGFGLLRVQGRRLPHP